MSWRRKGRSWGLTQRLTRAPAGQGGVTLGLEQDELKADFRYLGVISSVTGIMQVLIEFRSLQ
jgi:hypothetical protein